MYLLISRKAILLFFSSNAGLMYAALESETTVAQAGVKSLCLAFVLHVSHINLKIYTRKYQTEKEKEIYSKIKAYLPTPRQDT